MANSREKKIGGIVFTLSTCKKFKEDEFKSTWGKFLTVNQDAAWQQVQRFIEESKSKK